MSVTAVKLDYHSLESQKEFPLFSLFTRVLIESLCPILKSEILFGEVETSDGGEKFPFWIDANIKGDFEGKIGVGTDPHTLLVLAKHLGLVNSEGEPDLDRTLIYLHESLALGVEKQFSQEDFRCELSKGTGLVKNHQFTSHENPFFICPVETAYGSLKVYFSLKPNSQALIEELAARNTSMEPKKIRVFASQLEAMFANIKNLEALETRLLAGAQVRSQMRSQIKKLKRMVHQMKCESLETLFLPARKLAVEIAKTQGKQIRFTTTGTWLYLDKSLLNNLYEPILHLVRNAVDHGIEDTSERERTGKTAIGSVKCLAAFHPNGLKLLITDDGKGINFERVRERAVSKGILTAETAQGTENEELAEILFQPGFSTRERADSISGRGLGLDIVRKGIESVDGTIKIVSTSHHGTSFEIQVPLTDDFSLKKMALPALPIESSEEEERTLLVDELFHSLDRMGRALAAFDGGKNLTAAYEAFRLAHSIKGITGFLGWNRVAGFCHQYEELLKLVAEKKLNIDPLLASVVVETAARIKEFCEATRDDQNYPLYDVRRLEARILQAIWGATQSEERTQLFIGKYHLNAVETFIRPLSIGSSFYSRPESDFDKAIDQPYGALVQFSGDRRGFAGILMPESTYQTVIGPLVTGNHAKIPAKGKVGALSEFGKLMGAQIAELAHKNGLSLQSSLPVTYQGLGQPLKVLGNPTYCYSCEVNGNPFYLVGDFRLPQEMAHTGHTSELSYHPALVIQEAKRQCEKHFEDLGVPVQFGTSSIQSDIMGFDGAITTVIACRSTSKDTPDCVLFLSYDTMLAQSLHQAFYQRSAVINSETGEKVVSEVSNDLYDCLKEISNSLGGMVVTALESKKMPLQLGLPTVFIGKAYVANFNRLAAANKLVGRTAKGKFELQILMTHLSDG